MDSNLLIKYIEQNKESAGYDLGLLGESFSGFNSVFKELFEISQIQGELVIRTAKIEEGSIDVLNLIQVVVSSTPFKDPKDLMDFLQVVDLSLHQQASTFFNAIGEGHRTVNDFFKENQFDNNVVAGVISGLVVLYFPQMIAWAGKQKQQTTLQDENGNKISERYARRLRNMISTGKYKKAFKPLTENNISRVQVTATKKTAYTVSIDEASLENYLPEEEKILPDLENGTEHNFSGEILALQSTRGETLRFKAYGIDPAYQLLLAHPADGKKTEDYMNFYKKQVNIKAQIYRKTLYKKPEIIIQEIELAQGELFNE